MNLQRFQPKHGVGSRNRSAAGHDSAFTLNELLVVLATLGILALLVLPALGNAKVNSRQLSCLDNLRQLGIAVRIYVVEYQQYTGSYRTANGTYIWPTRLLGYTGGQRSLFSCPAALPSARWDTNLNNTLAGPAGFTLVVGEDGKRDRYAILSGQADGLGTRFSYGINDWGLDINASPQLGLGGDIDGVFGGRGPVRDGDVVAPSQMIMLGDTPGNGIIGTIRFAANLDPTDNNPEYQLPSNRHQYLTDFVFTDGHAETPLRSDVINPATNNPWRSRWNNDNQPHNEFTWTVNTNTVLLDPSY